MDAFQLLKEDHRKVEQLFQQLESARGSAAKLRVFEQIKTELELHTHIEEKIFYPATEEPKETHDLTLEAYEEHDVVKNLLRELSRAKSADEEWEAQAKVLQENVEHHVEEEENELFPKAEAALGEEEVEELGERMAMEKERKQAGKSSKKSARKATKKGGTKKAASAAKRASSSSAAKRAPRSGSKKSGSKKSGAKKSRSKKSAAKKR